jgi:membrane protease YdiL (CAAX protease family)
MSEPDRKAGRDALIAWAIVGVLVAGFVRINVKVQWVGHVGSALVALVFLYAPMVVGKLRKEDLDDYGFREQPVGRGLAIAGSAMAVVFPFFALAYFAFYEIACNSHLLAHLVPRGLCASYGGLQALHAPKLDGEFFKWAAGQYLVVALPEELFFRGMLLCLLEKRFPPKRRWLGGGIGLALVLSAAAFALVHLPKDGDPRALATFFPGLLFGWMRSATGSILASTITHGSSNVLVRVLELAVTR